MKETKFKQTEVGMIPSDWGVAKLGDFVKKIDAGVSVNSDESIYSDNYVLKTSAIHNGVINYKEVKAVIKKDIHRLKCPLKEDCLIVSRMNTPDLVGECAYSEKDVDNIFLPDRLWLVPNEFKNKISFKLINYVLNTPLMRNAIKGTATGTSNSMKNISKGKFLSIECAFPPTIEEQQRIANALSDVDTLIGNLEKLIAKKKNIKQGAMQQLLTGKIRLDDFSEKWIYVKIKDIFRVTRGYVLNFSLVSPFCDSCTPYPVFSSQTSNKGVMGYYRSYLYENAITWTTDGANAGDVNYRDGRFYCTNVCGVLLSDKGFANECIAGILSLCSKSYVSYVGNPKLMNNVMAEIEILIPPSLEEQTAIANVLSDMDTEISALETKLAKYRTLKTGMMQQLLTGKIRLIPKR